MIKAIIFNDGNENYSSWSNFNISKEDEEKIMEILSKYETDGDSVSGSKQEVLDELIGNRVILQEGRYAIIDRGHEYVLACGYDGKGWELGYYYSHWNNERQKAISLLDVVDHFMAKTDKTHISRSRLVELATYFKDGLLCDDEESAMEYFEKFCDMNETEMQFFGLGEEEE